MSAETDVWGFFGEVVALAVSGVAAVVVGCFLLWSVGVALVVAGVARWPALCSCMT